MSSSFRTCHNKFFEKKDGFMLRLKCTAPTELKRLVPDTDLYLYKSFVTPLFPGVPPSDRRSVQRFFRGATSHIRTHVLSTLSIVQNRSFLPHKGARRPGISHFRVAPLPAGRNALTSGSSAIFHVSVSQGKEGIKGHGFFFLLFDKRLERSSGRCSCAPNKRQDYPISVMGSYFFGVSCVHDVQKRRLNQSYIPRASGSAV